MKCWPNECWLKGIHLWWRDFKYSLEADIHPLPVFQAVGFTPALQRRAYSHISSVPYSLKSLVPFNLFSFHIPFHFTLCNQRQSSSSHLFTSWFISHYGFTVSAHSLSGCCFTCLQFRLFFPLAGSGLPGLPATRSCLETEFLCRTRAAPHTPLGPERLFRGSWDPGTKSCSWMDLHLLLSAVPEHTRINSNKLSIPSGNKFSKEDDAHSCLLLFWMSGLTLNLYINMTTAKHVKIWSHNDKLSPNCTCVLQKISPSLTLSDSKNQMILYFSTAAQSQSWGQPFFTLSSATLPTLWDGNSERSRPRWGCRGRVLCSAGSLHLWNFSIRINHKLLPPEPTIPHTAESTCLKPHSFILCPPSP